jgi:PleD family two-component response regulator
MLDEKALILIAHSDRRTLIALYTLLDDEGYFVAPCFSRDDLLKYCTQYKPELVMTSNPLSDDEGGRLLETIKERSPTTKILLLPDVLSQESRDAFLAPSRTEEFLRIAEALPVSHPPVHLNGY